MFQKRSPRRVKRSHFTVSPPRHPKSAPSRNIYVHRHITCVHTVREYLNQRDIVDRGRDWLKSTEVEQSRKKDGVWGHRGGNEARWEYSVLHTLPTINEPAKVGTQVKRHKGGEGTGGARLTRNMLPYLHHPSINFNPLGTSKN